MGVNMFDPRSIPGRVDRVLLSLAGHQRFGWDYHVVVHSCEGNSIIKASLGELCLTSELIDFVFDVAIDMLRAPLLTLLDDMTGYIFARSYCRDLQRDGMLGQVRLEYLQSTQLEINPGGTDKMGLIVFRAHDEDAYERNLVFLRFRA